MGTSKTAIHNLLGWNRSSGYNSRLIDANKVVFSSFGSNVYVSDIVKTAIHRVAEEVSKCNIKSVNAARFQLYVL